MASHSPSMRPAAGNSAAAAMPLSARNCFTTGQMVEGSPAITSHCRPASFWIFTASSSAPKMASGRGARPGKSRAKGFWSISGMAQVSSTGEASMSSGMTKGGA